MDIFNYLPDRIEAEGLRQEGESARLLGLHPGFIVSVP
jgi:hypothetical protein